MDIDTSMHIIEHKILQLIELLRTVFGSGHVQLVLFGYLRFFFFFFDLVFGIVGMLFWDFVYLIEGTG